jgi:hypothetical protein
MLNFNNFKPENFVNANYPVNSNTSGAAITDEQCANQIYHVEIHAGDKNAFLAFKGERIADHRSWKTYCFTDAPQLVITSEIQPEVLIAANMTEIQPVICRASVKPKQGECYCGRPLQTRFYKRFVTVCSRTGRSKSRCADFASNRIALRTIEKNPGPGPMKSFMDMLDLTEEELQQQMDTYCVCGEVLTIYVMQGDDSVTACANPECCGSLDAEQAANVCRLMTIEKNPGPKCFNCHLEGHSVKDCPAPKICYNCNKPGHISAKCAEPKSINFIENKNKKKESRVKGRGKKAAVAKATSDDLQTMLGHIDALKEVIRDQNNSSSENHEPKKVEPASQVHDDLSDFSFEYGKHKSRLWIRNLVVFVLMCLVGLCYFWLAMPIAAKYKADHFYHFHDDPSEPCLQQEPFWYRNELDINLEEDATEPWWDTPDGCFSWIDEGTTENFIFHTICLKPIPQFYKYYIWKSLSVLDVCFMLSLILLMRIRPIKTYCHSFKCERLVEMPENDSDQRTDSHAHGEIKYNDPKLMNIEYIKIDPNLQDFWTISKDEHVIQRTLYTLGFARIQPKKPVSLLVSAEALTQFLSCEKIVLTDSYENNKARVERSMKNICSINFPRYSILDCHQDVIGNSSLVALHYLLYRKERLAKAVPLDRLLN